LIRMDQFLVPSRPETIVLLTRGQGFWPDAWHGLPAACGFLGQTTGNKRALI
jgi:hypothetical protein